MKALSGITLAELEVKKTFQLEAQKNPYMEAIKCLREINQAESPLKKIKIFIKISSTISECVAMHWKGKRDANDKIIMY